MTTAEAARLLLGWDELLLLTHVRPDGDTVGSDHCPVGVEIDV